MNDMGDPLLRILPWAIALTLGFPLLLVVLGELEARAECAGWRITTTLRGVRRHVIPALALVLFVHFVLERPTEDTLTRLAATALWIIVLLETLNFINHVVFVTAAEGSWQSRVPTLLRDIIRFVLVGIGAALIYSVVWGEAIKTAWAALGLGSVVIALALQESLGNMISGLILLAERPLIPGDWITVDGVTGKVLAINWRAVHILTATRELKIVPNSSLYKGSFSNLSRPDLIRAETVELSFPCEVPPNRVKKQLLDLLQSLPIILTDPPPNVIVANYQGCSLVYKITFCVACQEDLWRARDTFLTCVWYVARRERLMPEERAESASTPARPIDLLQGFPQFQVSDQLKQELSSRIALRRYGAGERIIAEDGLLDGLYVVISGEVVLTTRDREGHEHEIGRVGRGEFFGESTILAGQPSDFAVSAREDSELLILDPDVLPRLLDSAPRLVRDIGFMLEARRKAVQSIRSLVKDKRGTAAPGTLDKHSAATS